MLHIFSLTMKTCTFYAFWLKSIVSIKTKPKKIYLTVVDYNLPIGKFETKSKCY